MKKVGIIGGETHIGEVTALSGKGLDIVAAAVREDQTEWAEETFGCPVVSTTEELLAQYTPDIAAIANENDLKASAVLQALKGHCDIIVDKPLAMTLEQQKAIEDYLADHPQQKLLMLLTLRGNPVWKALRNVIQQGTVGTSAFVHIRMAVRLKRQQRPPWFLDVRRSGGLFLDLLIHGLDQVEWLTGKRIVAMTAHTGNLGFPEDIHLRDHAAVYCELDDGSTAIVEGQRMLPDTKGSDYRVLVAGTQGYADLSHASSRLTVTSAETADQPITTLPEPDSVVEDWLCNGSVIRQADSLRANHLAIQATLSAAEHKQIIL